METAPSSALLSDLDEIRERCEALAVARLPIGVDCETGYHGDSREGAALHAEENFIVSVQITNDPSWARLIPLAFDTGVNADSKAVAALLWPLFHVTDDEGLPLVVAHGAIAELRWLARWFLRHLHDHPLFGRQVIAARGYYPVRSCTMLESFAEGRNLHHGLKFITALPEPAGFGHKMRELADLQAKLLGKPPTEKEKNSVRFNVFDPGDPEVVAYACEDAVYALQHHRRRWPRVRKTFPYRLEMAVLPIVCQMADDGVAYDWNLLRATASEARAFAERLLAEIVEDFEEVAGEKLPPDFNFNSGPQFADLLYNKCGMPVLHWTDGGKSGIKKPSVDAKNALPGLAKQYPVVKKYMGWKRLTTLCVNFLEIYEDKYSWALDGRAHPMLLQHGTIAGRFSCEAMNYQQSPGKYHYELRDGTVFHFNFRDAIVPAGPGYRPWHVLVLEEAGCTDLPEPEELGYYYLGFDYSQIELRVMAAEAGETALLESFARGEDVHSRTAALMLGISIEQVDEQGRKTGKTGNFASIYGQGAQAFADQLGISLEEGREKKARYNDTYPRLQAYRRRTISRAKSDGFVITKFGRRVTLHRIKDENPKVRAAEERTAGNAVIQGPATGDYVKRAMIRAVKALKDAGLSDKVRLVMNIHDALGAEVRRDVTPAEVIKVLQPAVVYPVNGPGAAWPEMVAEWHMGRSWGSVRDIHLEDGQVAAGKRDKCPRCNPPAPVPESRHVVIALGQVPAREQVAWLGRYVKSVPGGDSVELRLPDGASLPVGFTCGLAPEREGYLAGVLGFSVTVRYASPAAAEL